MLRHSKIPALRLFLSLKKKRNNLIHHQTRQKFPCIHNLRNQNVKNRWKIYRLIV